MADSALERTLQPGRQQRVLVIAPSWIGDMVMAQSLFIALAAGGGSRIDVLAPAWAAPLLARMPEVERSISAPFEHGRLQLRERLRLGRDLAGHYQRAIVLPNSWKSALVPFFARIPVRTGYLGEQRWGLLNDIRPLDKAALPMTVQRFSALAGARRRRGNGDSHVHPRLSSSEESRRTTAATLGLSPAGKPVAVLCPGAEFGPAKRWPAAHFAEVGRAKLDQNWQVWLVGTAGDADVAARINRLCGGRCEDLTGRTSIEQAVDVVAMSSVVITNDSGLMHIAAALDRPVVAIYGSSDPAHTPPLCGNSELVSLGLPCSPCFERSCPLDHLNCLTQLHPARVLAAMDMVLAKVP